MPHKSDLFVLKQRCTELFNDHVTRSTLPTPYKGIYEWGKALGTRRWLAAGQLVKIIEPLITRAGWGALRFLQYAGDIGMIVGKCDRHMQVGVWMVQFADGYIQPFPRDRLIADPDLVNSPRIGTSAAYFLNQSGEDDPQPGSESEDKAAHQAEIAAYVDPFEAGSQS
jgi:hypothetical protein